VPSRIFLRAPLTPARALLLTLGAVLGGVALSLLMSSSPAHAAEGDETGPGALTGPLVTATGSVTSSVTGAVGGSVSGAVSAVSRTVDASIPLVQHSVDAAGQSVAKQVPVAAPLVSPVVTSLDAVLEAVQHVVAPTVDRLPAVPGLLAVSQGEAATQLWTSRAGPVPMASGSPAASLPGGMSAAQNSGGPDGMTPGPVLTSATGSPAATPGLVLGALALVLLVARRRWRDDALPPSPAFETDTSPA
jgi:hypothetical protein